MKTRKLHWSIAVPAAVVAGTALDAATPWLGWWPLAFAGVALLFAALWHQRGLLGALLGALAGAAFWFPHLSWLTLYLGPIPWVALAGVMTAWFALFGAAAAFTTRWIAARRLSTPALLVLQAVVVSGLWVAREQVQGRWPFGGFDWGRLAHTQAEGPFIALSSWIGLAGLSGVVTLVVALIVAAWFSPWRRLQQPVIASAVTLVATFLLSFMPIAPLSMSGHITIAAVQGNSKSGIFDDRENGDVFRAHAAATETLLSELEADDRQIDVILWPENSAEFDVRTHPARVSQLREFARRAGAPIVVGSILRDTEPMSDAPRYTNSAIVVEASGLTEDRYDKRRPVPFAEYMPNREFFHALVPDLVDLVQLEYDFGDRPTVMQLGEGDSAFLAGIAICFDIIFDDQASLMAREGAQIVFAPTNNADFGRTDQSAQQLQVARTRAVEVGRTLVNISTVGTSAVVASDGSTLAALEPHTSGAMVVEVPLYDGLTPAMSWGRYLSALWSALGFMGAATSVIATIWSRFTRPARG